MAQWYQVRRLIKLIDKTFHGSKQFWLNLVNSATLGEKTNANS